MTYQEIEKLNRDKTIFLMALSPLETHGPHLPVGTDLIVSEQLLLGYAKKLSQKYPDYDLIKMPSLPFGGSLLPVKGSIEIKARNLEKILFDISKNLSEMGFKYLFLADNHGGPAHQMAIEAASQKVAKKLKFNLIDPFNYVFKMMVEHDDRLLDQLSSKEGAIGDDPDLHAGNNETSLMLHLSPEQVDHYQEIKDSLIPEYKGIAKIIKKISEVFNSKSLAHLAVNLAWINDDQMTPYLGKPAQANFSRGKEMVNARIEIAMQFFDKVIKGEKIKEKPMLWNLRFLRYFF
jgi:creatinine amidohydrolase/Fe(II)-dependent formamide hydrolase-like protein